MKHLERGLQRNSKLHTSSTHGKNGTKGCTGVKKVCDDWLESSGYRSPSFTGSEVTQRD